MCAYAAVRVCSDWRPERGHAEGQNVNIETHAQKHYRQIYTYIIVYPDCENLVRNLGPRTKALDNEIPRHMYHLVQLV